MGSLITMARWMCLLPGTYHYEISPHHLHQHKQWMEIRYFREDWHTVAPLIITECWVLWLLSGYLWYHWRWVRLNYTQVMWITQLLFCSYDELLVGAPMYSLYDVRVSPEVGRLYIYFNNRVWVCWKFWALIILALPHCRDQSLVTHHS